MLLLPETGLEFPRLPSVSSSQQKTLEFHMSVSRRRRIHLVDLQRMMLLYINAVPIDYKSPLGVFSQRAFTMPDFSAIFYFSCFLITQCIRIPFRISKLSIFKPLFSQQLLITLFLATLTSPCPTRFASGNSIASIQSSSFPNGKTKHIRSQYFYV